ncbi:MAG: C10 family peptidase [Paludibacteraceae bacterium]|nr:C10 family peptidase [Paludibacteraceae bacterium]
MKRITIIFSVLLLSMISYAEQRSMDDVMRIAGKFLPTAAQRRCVRSSEIINSNIKQDAFYVVSNQSNKGFVIVSSDTRMPAVLAISDEEVSWTDNQIPEHIMWVLNSYSDGLARINNGEAADEVFPQLSIVGAKNEVTSLLGDIKYDQGYPYNMMCPKKGSQNCLTGCVATAMAQLMRYYKYPECGVGTFTVNSSGKSLSVDLSKMPFDWNNMLASYKGSDFTTAQAEAVATLMYACGASVNMNYGVDGSSSQSDYVQPALTQNFGYSNAARYVQGEGTDPNQKPYFDWIPTLIEQFEKGHPVYFAGAPGGAGHAFLLDGYKGAYVDNVEDVLFHVNWGWSGEMNGFFYLNNLNPDGTNYAGFRSEWVFNIYPESWTSIQVVEGSRETGKIYNIFGQEVQQESLQPNTIYIRDGKKFIK